MYKPFYNKRDDRFCTICHRYLMQGETISWNRKAPKGSQASYHVDDRGQYGSWVCENRAKWNESIAIPQYALNIAPQATLRAFPNIKATNQAQAMASEHGVVVSKPTEELASISSVASQELARIQALTNKIPQTTNTETYTLYTCNNCLQTTEDYYTDWDNYSDHFCSPACEIEYNKQHKGDNRDMETLQTVHSTTNHNATNHNGNGNGSNDLASILAKAIEGKLNLPSQAIDAGQVQAIVSEQVKPLSESIELLELMNQALTEKIDSIALASASASKEIEVKRFDGSVVNVGRTHKQYEQILNIVASGEEVYLWGEAGAGKTTLCKQIAKALGVRFMYDSLDFMSPASVVKGLINANGDYVPSKLYECYKNGGLYLLDEMDNANSNLLSSLNTCLGNGYGSFGNEMVERHPDFYFIGAGNTNGYGRTNRYPSRQKFDGAFKDRFVCVPFEYDHDLELFAAECLNQEQAKTWCEYVWSVRQFVISQEIEVLVTPRASIKGSKLLKLGYSFSDVAEMAIFKGVAASIKERILQNCALPRK